MIPSSLTRPALMDTSCLSSTYWDEPERVSSGAWVMTLMKEIDEPDEPHPSLFDDVEGGDHFSEKFRISSSGQDGASVSANDAGTQRVRLPPMASAYSAAEQFSPVDIDREQSWESLCRESSLFAARASAAGLPRRETNLATAAAVSDEEQASRKRKAPSSKSVTREKRALVEPSSKRAPSPVAENTDADALCVRKQDIRDYDVLKGRGGLSNRHVGNKWFRKIVVDMKEMYQKMSVKTDKTALSRAIVEYVHAKGGRFLIKNPNGKVGWRVMSKAESRKKTSQALREPKEFKWTLASESPTQEPTRRG